MNTGSQEFEFEKLSVYQKSLEFIDTVYDITGKYPYSEKFGLRDQFRRSAVSVALNIAEGAGRYNRKEKVQFFRMSKASVNECVAILQISARRGYISFSVYQEVYSICLEVAKMLRGLITTQNKKK